MNKTFCEKCEYYELLPKDTVRSPYCYMFEQEPTECLAWIRSVISGEHTNGLQFDMKENGILPYVLEEKVEEIERRKMNEKLQQLRNKAIQNGMVLLSEDEMEDKGADNEKN
jgi:hypothetical protein